MQLGIYELIVSRLMMSRCIIITHLWDYFDYVDHLDYLSYADYVDGLHHLYYVDYADHLEELKIMHSKYHLPFIYFAIFI